MTSAALVLCAVFVLLAPVTNALGDTQVAPTGSGGGEVLEPSALTVDSSNGNLYAADRGNRRVDVFNSTGEFLRAFGWGVVAGGANNDPRNEIEQVEVAATGGSFTLLFVQNNVNPVGGSFIQETGFVAFNAPASAVQAALEGLPALSPGDVAVSGPAGGPWTIEFKGVFADTDLHQLEQGSASALTGGLGKLNISTTQDGGSYEVCEADAGDDCRAGQRGVKAGQVNPSSIAVDPATHAVYVFDGLESVSTNEAFNNRVQKFTSEGAFVYMLGGGVNVDTGEDICTAASGDICGRGAPGAGSSEFGSASSSVAVGPGGTLYVNDGDGVQKFDSSGSFLGEVAISGVFPSHLAVDSAGAIYVAAPGEVRKYNSTGTLQHVVPISNLGAIAVDAADRLYLSDLLSGEHGIRRFSSTGAPEAVFYSRLTPGTPIRELAPVAPAGGDVFTVEEEVMNLIQAAPAGPVVYPDPASVFASGVTNVKATFHSEVNPEGKATTFHYQYVEQEAFESEGGWSSPKVQETAESSSISSDFQLHQAVTQATGLTPEASYRFRVVASNADGETFGPEGTLATEDPVKFGSLWVTDAGTDSAILNGEINPFGFATTGYFEYVDDAAYQGSGFASAAKTPLAPIDFGGGEAFVEGSSLASSLQPGTAYHYRLVVTNNCKPSEPSVVCTFNGPEETFSTLEIPMDLPACPANVELRTDSDQFLLDCRAYEMVSPVGKNGVNLEVVFSNDGYRAGLDQSSNGGDTISYSAYRAFADPEGSPYTSQYLAERLSGGWQTKSIALPREGPTLFTVSGLDYQFKAFTEDLCSGWPLQDTDLLMAPGAIPGYPNLYRRDNCEPSAGSYQAVTTASPLGSAPEPAAFFPELQGISEDGTKSFFAVKAKLTPESSENLTQVYESSGVSLDPVCVLPEGSVTLSGCSLGTGSSFGERNPNVDTAVSSDGSVVYWANATFGGALLYVRVGGSETFSVSAENSQFWVAAEDGSKAIYTTGEKLFEFDLATKTSKQIAEGVKGVAGASEDVSKLYFVSTKSLASGATAGQLNLYRYATGTFQFIGALVSDDLPPPVSRPSLVSIRPFLRTSRVTPDGERLVFMSAGRLTGYDNTDVVNGEAAAEVFLYDATADGGDGELLCISCNPTGGRPVGQAWKLGEIAGGHVAAFVPGWTTHLYASRVISDDGSRVFFNSFDALVARDQNEAQDVYEWEAPGSGNCEVDGYAYVESAGGCVNLISSGESDQPSEFVDASASGDDVFFKTYSSLVPQDPGLVDIYDARVGGGLPSPAGPAPDPSCEGEGCMGPAGSEPDHPTPQSSTFVGPGNVVEKGTKPKKCPKGKHKVRRKGKVVCAKNKKPRKHKSGRAGK